MPQPPNDPVLIAFYLGMMLFGITACMNLIAMRRKGCLLPYEPRQPVPWGAVGCVLALTLLLSVVAAGLSSESEPIVGPPMSPTPVGLITAMLGQLFIVGAFLFVVAAFTKATSRDLGLSSNKRQRVRDVSIGAVACLAAFAPVHIVQVAMMHTFFPDKMESGQPLIKMVMAKPDPTILLLAAVATVVVAPICEEITFRLLLQGWLERWEDERLGWRRATIETPLIDDATHTDQPNQHERLSPDTTDSLPDPEPPRQGIAGLPYGWLPIIISSIAFGVAHYGYGPEPVPIFLLGLVLGYLYQRTHRIVPGIVTHALFNLFTMIMLWRMVYRG